MCRVYVTYTWHESLYFLSHPLVKRIIKPDVPPTYQSCKMARMHILLTTISSVRTPWYVLLNRRSFKINIWSFSAPSHLAPQPLRIVTNLICNRLCKSSIQCICINICLTEVRSLRPSRTNRRLALFDRCRVNDYLNRHRCLFQSTTLPQ